MSDYGSPYKQVFQQFDLNGDGHISVNELSVALRAAGVNIDDEALQEILKSADMDASGGLNFQEFVAFINLATQANGNADSVSPRLKELFIEAADGFDLVSSDDLASFTATGDEHGLTTSEAAVLKSVLEMLQGRSVDLNEFADLWRRAENRLAVS